MRWLFAGGLDDNLEDVGEDGLTAGDYSDASLDYCKLLFNFDFRSHCTSN